MIYYLRLNKDGFPPVILPMEDYYEAVDIGTSVVENEYADDFYVYRGIGSFDVERILEDTWTTRN